MFSCLCEDLCLQAGLGWLCSALLEDLKGSAAPADSECRSSSLRQRDIWEKESESRVFTCYLPALHRLYLPQLLPFTHICSFNSTETSLSVAAGSACERVSLLLCQKRTNEYFKMIRFLFSTSEKKYFNDSNRRERWPFVQPQSWFSLFCPNSWNKQEDKIIKIVSLFSADKFCRISSLKHWDVFHLKLDRRKLSSKLFSYSLGCKK